MIASRFKTLGWVAAVAVAALASYLVTQRVAGTRAQLARAERDLMTVRHDIRRLGTEIETRGRLAQLERWNQDVLALGAARPQQYLDGTLQLAGFNQPGALPLDPRATPPAVRQAAYAALPPPAAPAEPMLRHATYVKPAEDRVAPVASDAFVADLEKLAAAEAAKSRP